MDRLAGMVSALRNEPRPEPVETPQFTNIPQPLAYSLAASVTLVNADLNLHHVINCTSASNVTLPGGIEGGFVSIENRGTAAITVKNPGATTICVIRQYQRALIPCLVNSSGDADWATGVVVYGSNGSIYVSGPIISRDDTVGTFLKSPGGNFWRVTMTNTGAITTADTGTTEAVPPEPTEV